MINLKTAKALRLDVPDKLLVIADGLIEVERLLCCDCSGPVLAHLRPSDMSAYLPLLEVKRTPK
jgi:hypothetical protein